VIDIDPFGSAVPFIESAVDGVTDGGMLCITCTDSRVLCGPDYQKCQYYYGSVRAKVIGIQENGLRVLVQTVSAAANRHGKVIEPLFTIQAEFYLRVFVRVHRKKGECRNAGLKLGHVINCNACGAYTQQPLFWEKDKGKLKATLLDKEAGRCECCGSSTQLNGPIWLSALNSQPFMETMLAILAEETKMVLKSGKQISGLIKSTLQEQREVPGVALPLSF
jgi:tRNA (guanine26-N2/guanine27-N2)-dimethyltransferase